MGEALDRVVEVLAGVSEDEVAAALAAVGASRPRASAPLASLGTPLPRPGSAPHIVSEVEWV
ncbi:hypothetical protein BEK98_36405 [Streptomyces diastatochromogenes]|uniref:Uncharacterized protein n=1 Tax=Streptomyces diastatochromogenes TaxID=42236 RepID=A0A233S2H2_STRDA|nr:hypothetical protein BEK98_36405 [Streptomyces diastatochromogenes]